MVHFLCHPQLRDERGSSLNAEEVSAHLRRIWRARHRTEREEGGAEGDTEMAEAGAGEGVLMTVLSVLVAVQTHVASRVVLMTWIIHVVNSVCQ